MSLQPGKYLARAIPDTLQFGRAKTGTEQVAITFRILDGQTQKETNEQITWIGALGNEKSVEITGKALRACGCNDPEELDAHPEIIARNIVELDCDNETYNGKTRLRVNWVNVPGGGRFAFKQSLDAGSKVSALARLKGVIAKENAADGGGEIGGGTTGTVDDIPF